MSHFTYEQLESISQSASCVSMYQSYPGAFKSICDAAAELALKERNNLEVENQRLKDELHELQERGATGYRFYLNMQKRSDGKVYCDLHKTDERIYFSPEEAQSAIDADPELKKYRHVVAAVATLDGSVADDAHKIIKSESEDCNVRACSLCEAGVL